MFAYDILPALSVHKLTVSNSHAGFNTSGTTSEVTAAGRTSAAWIILPAGECSIYWPFGPRVVS